MELWFIFALGSVLMNGLGSFSIKVAAQRGYDSSVVVFSTAVVTLLLLIPFTLSFDGVRVLTMVLALVAFGSGVLISGTAILKINALRHIDSTIYFPLFKMVSPAITIVLGLLLFGETFSTTEWVGLIFSLLVPLLLIHTKENARQSNLLMGLVLVLVTGLLSALSAGIQKYATDQFDAVLWIVFFAQLGVLFGAMTSTLLKNTPTNFVKLAHDQMRGAMLFFIVWRSVAILLGFAATVYAYELGGPLGVVYTIGSLYILVPIILSIIFYDEHWDIRKICAIILSIAALGFLN